MQIDEDELQEYIYNISAGDEQALREFYDKYGRLILSFINSVVGTREAAEEVMQDVLMSIVSYGSNKPKDSARGWLFSVIMNASKKKLKDEKACAAEPLWENEELPDDRPLSDAIENSADQIEALECLDETERRCVIMHILGRMSLKEISAVLGIPYRTLRNKYTYAVKKLRKYYRERGTEK